MFNVKRYRSQLKVYPATVSFVRSSNKIVINLRNTTSSYVPSDINDDRFFI